VKEIKLTKNKVAIVDDEDFKYLNYLKWHTLTVKDLHYAVAKSGKLLMHRIIMNPNKGQCVDHINGNSLDNRKSNLRLCSHSENMRNRKQKTKNKSGYKGIYPSGKKWRTYIQIDKKNTYIGTYDNIKDAINAYNEASIKYFGKFANLVNF